MKRRDVSGQWDVPVSDGNGSLHVGKSCAVRPASALAEWLWAKFATICYTIVETWVLSQTSYFFLMILLIIFMVFPCKL